MDKQGLTGKKAEIYSTPYRSIDMWSTENAGGFISFSWYLSFFFHFIIRMITTASLY